MKKITLLIYTLTVFVFLSLTQKTNAQLQNTNWYFGSEIGLNFSDGTQDPTILTNSLMDTSGGSASISDDLGNLLFYTNGINVWNNLHTIMPNGSGLLGGTNISQSVIIVPDPSDTNKYYVFTNQGDSMGASGLYYSIIDMTLDNGSGDIVTNDKKPAEDVPKVTPMMDSGEPDPFVLEAGMTLVKDDRGVRIVEEVSEDSD